MICNNCNAYFHDPDTISEQMDDEYNGQRSFIGYSVCPECKSTDIEETDSCVCGEVKRKSDSYCENCTDIARKLSQCAITDIMEFIPKLTRPQARELLKDYVRENL